MILNKRQMRIIKKLQQELTEMNELGAIELDMWPNAQLFVGLVVTDKEAKE
jgi:hypothetical protein